MVEKTPTPFSLAEEARTRAQGRAQLLLHLRAKGVRDLNVLRALEQTPREIFAPSRFQTMAMRDVALPIGCGQTMTEPFLLARMLEALQLTPSCQILEIGAGSGFSAAVLSRLGREVLSFEQFQTLALDARTRLERLAIGNAAVAWADGFEASATVGRFDRILVDACVAEIPDNLVALLGEDGIIVAGVATPADGCVLMRLSRNDKGEFEETNLGPCRLQAMTRGLSRAI